MNDKLQPPSLQRILDTMKEYTLRRKEYYKFVIGLSTGTLVFSVTFVEKFSLLQVYKPIILIGWVCLVISIITGVWVLAKQDWSEGQVNSIISTLSNPQQIVLGFLPNLTKLLTEGIFDASLDPFLKELFSKQPNAEELINKLKQVVPKTSLIKGLLNSMASAIQETNPSLALLIRDMIKEAEGWAQLITKCSKSVYLPDMSRHLRQTIIRMAWVEKAMMAFFYAGIILIALFSAINFVAKP
jgi:hypothetical protein